MFHPVGPMSAESDLSVAVHGQANPCPPSDAVVVALDRFDRDLPLDAGDLPEQLCDARRLESPLRTQLHVLEIAAPAPARPGVRAGRLDPIGRGAEHLDGVGTEVRARCSGDASAYPFAREAMADENDLAVGRPGYAPATARDGTDLEFEELVATPGRHAVKRTAANLVKIPVSGCRFGSGPIVV
jgi:hypothetical protein